MKSVLVTGAAGQLGSAIVERFAGVANTVPLTRAGLDIADQAAVMALAERVRPSVIVNCAAYTRVDAAEDDPVPALDVNAFGVRALARAAAALDAVLVHYSTDFVFDGTASQPYREEDEANPQSFYAASKLLGEWFARDVPRHYVLRVESLFGGSPARSSVDHIVRGIRASEDVRVFADRWVSPSYVADVAEATWRLVGSAAPFGLYHCVNSGHATWLEVGREAARLLGREADLRPVSVRDVALRARRPQFCALSNEKLQQAGVTMPRWQDALARYLRTAARST